MSNVKDLRDAVATALNALDAMTGRSLTASTAFVLPGRDAKELAAAGEVWVSPSERETRAIARARTVDDEFGMQIAIYQRLGDDPEATAEANNLLAEAILAGMVGQQAGGLTCIAGRQLSIADPGHWREKRLFTTVLELRYR